MALNQISSPALPVAGRGVAGCTGKQVGEILPAAEAHLIGHLYDRDVAVLQQEFRFVQPETVDRFYDCEALRPAKCPLLFSTWQGLSRSTYKL